MLRTMKKLIVLILFLFELITGMIAVKYMAWLGGGNLFVMEIILLTLAAIIFLSGNNG